MMNKKLTIALMERELIKEDTELNCISTVIGFSGGKERVPQLLRVKSYSPKLDVFEGTDEHGRGRYTTTSEDVKEIEGMTPERFAKVYNIKADGSVKPPGKKRGRKSKGE